ncbi:double-stranded RNA-binding protein 1 isoform X10 [Arachis duranensis]|uniref:Double-stranded RNA-binding protein 1 isoform X10 n=1 Tax=Arachis duranensis TaxID=130453 RepID=A0A9C6T7L3_ARADU|nr:double-stranded RNA-binding protein 1 isoform X10 [Arachis duranensis]
MYKTKVQELCQKRSWNLPDYETTRDGPDHNPRFTAAVTVNGIRYETPSPCRNSKEAQNNAAMLAFEHLSSQQPSVINPSPPPFPPKPRLMLRPKPKPNNIPITGTPTLPGLDSFPQPTLFPGLSSFPQHPSLFAHSAASSAPSPHCTPGINNILPTSKVLPQKLEGGCQISQITGPVTAARDTVTTADRKSMAHLYKNQLQNYAQKQNLPLPVYTSEWEGPPHAMRFKCKVTIDGQTYECPTAFSKLKDAEHAAAEVALLSLLSGGFQEDNSVLYKNLLQELVQKEGFSLPAYNTERFGEAHIPIFISHVEVEGEVFTGQKAKTKKQAEISAAKVAYTTLKERSGEAHIPTFISHVEVEGEVFTGQEAKTKKQAEISAAKVAYTTLKERKGKSEQSSLLPLLDHPQKAPEPESLPDCSDSTVQTEFQHHANPNYPVIPGVISSSQPNKSKEKQCVKVCCNSLTKKIKEKKRRVCANPCTAIPSPEPVVTKKKGSSSASGCANGSMKDSFSSVVKAAAATPSLSDSKNVASNTNNMPSTASSSPGPRKRMVVYSRETNMEVEGGGTLMPISDDKWAAYEYSH